MIAYISLIIALSAFALSVLNIFISKNKHLKDKNESTSKRS